MGRPKAWLPLDGTPLLLHVVERVRPLVREVVIVAAAGQELPLAATATDAITAAAHPGVDSASLTIRIVRDPVPTLGPLAAVATGLGAITTTHALALACDAPCVCSAVLALLARQPAAFDAVMPLADDRPQPLVARYARRLAPALDRLVADGERRLQAIADRPRVRLLPPSALRKVDPDGVSFRTLNTPADYDALLRAWPRLRR